METSLNFVRTIDHTAWASVFGLVDCLLGNVCACLTGEVSSWEKHSLGFFICDCWSSKNLGSCGVGKWRTGRRCITLFFRCFQWNKRTVQPSSMSGRCKHYCRIHFIKIFVTKIRDQMKIVGQWTRRSFFPS